MGNGKNKDKTPLEYVLYAISIIATIFEVINLFTSGNAVFSNQFAATALVVIVLIIVASVCLIVLLRRNSPRDRFYNVSRRKLAVVALGFSLIGIIALVVFGFLYRPCLLMSVDIPQGKFGILVADFTEGAARAPTQNGKDISSDIFDALNDGLYFSSLSDKVVIGNVCAIRNEKEAIRAGKSANASMVLWGKVSNDVLKPEIALIDSPMWSANVDIREIISPVFGGDVNTENLPILSYRVETLAKFITGLVYLDNAISSLDYEIAVDSFSSAIQTVFDDYSFSSCNEIEDRAIRRALAILYTLRGRGNNALYESEKANADYLIALECDRLYSSAYIGIGNIKYANRDFSSAEEYYQKALDINTSASAYYSLANTKYYLGNYDASIEYYKKAIEITESNGYNTADIRFLLGETYNEMGLRDLAYEQYKLILESDLATDGQRNKASIFINMTREWLTAESSTPTLRPITTGTQSLSSPTATQILTTTVTFTPSPTLRPVTTALLPPPTILRPTTTIAPPTPDSCCKHCGPNSQPCGASCISINLTCSEPVGCACP